MTSTIAIKSVQITAADGLRLHAKVWGADAASQSVLVCLPGLARTVDDFETLAMRVAAEGRRRVVAFDYRGRGLSEWDRNWRNYDMRVENNDILTMLTALNIEHADFVGTSRGGLHLMMMAATRPGAMRRIVLNDIGPVIEAKGLARIRGYVGKLPTPNSWADAVDLCKHIMSAHFTGLTDEAWMTYARLTFSEEGGMFKPRYDPKLHNVLAAMDLNRPLPELWPQFEALKQVPMLAIRGENSDLLSPQTLMAMAKRHPSCDTLIAKGEGHAPLLQDEASISRIESFLQAGV